MYKIKEISIELKEPYFVYCNGKIITKELKKLKLIVCLTHLKIITKKQELCLSKKPNIEFLIINQDIMIHQKMKMKKEKENLVLDRT